MVHFFPLGDFENKRSNIFKTPSIKPRSFPKEHFPPISNRYLSGCRKAGVMILRGARVTKADPRLRLIVPFMPKPSQSKGGGKFCYVEDPHFPILSRLANRFPIHFAFSSGNLIASCPKKSSSDTINLHDDVNRNV
jgi:hypothetical protein